jgi:hypothetical protein
LVSTTSRHLYKHRLVEGVENVWETGARSTVKTAFSLRNPTGEETSPEDPGTLVFSVLGGRSPRFSTRNLETLEMWSG